MGSNIPCIPGHFVIGFPGETKRSIMKTINFAKKLDLNYAQFYCAVPFPGSELYEIAKKKKWIVNDDWTYFEQNFSVMDCGPLKAKDVMKLRGKAYRSFYFRPKIVLKNLSKLKSIKNISVFTRMLKEFFGWI